MRKGVALALSRALRLSQDEKLAGTLATQIEDALREEYGEDEKYSAMARALAFNLRENCELRESVCDGSVPVPELVRKDAFALARSEIREFRAKQLDAKFADGEETERRREQGFCSACGDDRVLVVLRENDSIQSRKR